MKLLVLALVLSFGLPQQAAKPAPGGTPAKSVATHATNPALPARKIDAANAAGATGTALDVPAQDRHIARNDSDLESRLTWFTGVLAAAALLQLVTLLWHASGLRKIRISAGTHAQEMEYQSRVLDNQLKVMADQLTAVKDTASAACSSAAAARETIDLMVCKERARLRVELQPFYLNFNAPSPARFQIQHQGSTDAFVLDSRAAVYVSDSRDPDRSAQSGRPVPLPAVIGALNPVITGEDLLHPFTEEEIDRIRELKSFVHFTGSIRYKDVFEGEHETRFNRVWSIARMSNLNDEPFTYWEHCGSVDENQET
jgi:hypothetical protein